MGSCNEPGPASLILSLPAWSYFPMRSRQTGIMAHQGAGGGTEADFPESQQWRLSPLGHPLPSTGPAQLEAIRAHSTTSDQVHGEVLQPCPALRRVRRCCCKCAAGSELPQHLFPSRILIILHLSTLQGANGVIMRSAGSSVREGAPSMAHPSQPQPRGQGLELKLSPTLSPLCQKACGLPHLERRRVTGSTAGSAGRLVLTLISPQQPGLGLLGLDSSSLSTHT